MEWITVPNVSVPLIAVLLILKIVLDYRHNSNHSGGCSTNKLSESERIFLENLTRTQERMCLTMEKVNENLSYMGRVLDRIDQKT